MKLTALMSVSILCEIVISVFSLLIQTLARQQEEFLIFACKHAALLF